MANNTPDFNRIGDDTDDSDSEYTPLYDDGDELE